MPSALRGFAINADDATIHMVEAKKKRVAESSSSARFKSSGIQREDKKENLTREAGDAGHDRID